MKGCVLKICIPTPGPGSAPGEWQFLLWKLMRPISGGWALARGPTFIQGQGRDLETPAGGWQEEVWEGRCTEVTSPQTHG